VGLRLWRALQPKQGARAAHVVSGLAELGITVRETVFL